MLSKYKHRWAVSKVFDDNLTVCSGCMTICGWPKAIENKKMERMIRVQRDRGGWK
ncbi:hypothetical protein PEX1_058980 [Penicillium expansum]|uniref:Uncharacterized protein n=1 Tax=Penicillium expansum TaxID=27334 RepID=A0A0A2JDS7_PENEN|nr:hypothetical protein PEX2_083420 [Penicillium expansum]KGO43598.1 hypothetical protein PEXP_095000 [Penicillium expansum]KGO52808.1 hypothetical protein PEX2_083420 [Penicillium expansum]KGO70526.1 hypothetical protein PEX1_058980 [Penicillium expansum]